jgi:large subunit ribosomal protein L4
MNVDLYSSTGAKAGTMELPKELFEAPVRHGLIHQAVMLQQGNRRKAIAHAKGRSEVAGSTRKLYAQKHTGRARRGSSRSPLLRGGGKAFGPRKDRNFSKDMPKSMRHAALASSLSLQAKKGMILGLEGYPDSVKTATFVTLMSKLPVQAGHRVLLVTPVKNDALFLSSRNVQRVKVIVASYLNPEDVMNARSIIFLKGAVEKAVEIFTKRSTRVKAAEMATEEKSEKKQKMQRKQKSTETTAQTPKKRNSKKSSASSASSNSSVSS